MSGSSTQIKLEKLEANQGIELPEIKESQQNDDGDNMISVDEERNFFREMRTPSWRRGRFRVIVLTMILLLITLIGLLIGSLTGRTDDYNFLLDSTKVITLNVDNCYISLEMGAIDDGKVRVEISVSHSKVEVVSEENTISVNNNRNLWEKYTSYKCSIKVTWSTDSNKLKLVVNDIGRLGSSVSGSNIKFGSLSIFTLYNTVQTSMTLDTYTGDNIFFNSSKIYMNLKRGSSNIEVNSTTGDIYLDSKENLLIQLSNPNTMVCLNSHQTLCTADLGNTSCLVYELDAGSSLLPKNILLKCTDCYLHALASVEDKNPIRSIISTVSGIGMTDANKDRIKAAFKSQTPVREQVVITVEGAGSPTGKWIWASRMLYIVFPPSFFDVFSWRLLTPRIATTSVSLRPTFCPGDTSDPSLDNLVDIDSLLKSLNVTTAAPESIWVFQTVKSYGFPQETYRVLVEPISGENYLFSPTFATNGRLLAILITNVLLSALSTAYIAYITFKKLWRWRKKRISTWGKLLYGDKWRDLRDSFFLRTGPYFMSEFIVGFPRNQPSFKQACMTVIVHLTLIFGTVAPLTIASALYHVATENYFGTVPKPSIAGYIISAIFVAVSLIHLFCYYIGVIVPYSIQKVVNYLTYAGLYTLVVFDLAYVVSVAYWILLGALIKPNDVLPFASVVIVLAIHVGSTAIRVEGLIDQLEISKQKHDAVIRNAPAPSSAPTSNPIQLKGTINVVQGLTILKESQILEITELTIREQIVKEIIIFFIVLLLFIFILIGFMTLSVSQDIASAVGSVVVFLIGGGVNVPLNNNLSADRDKRWEKEIIKQANAEKSVKVDPELKKNE